jgi:hypothetical protein
VCGCSLGGNYFGILPLYNKNFVGLRWSQAKFIPTSRHAISRRPIKINGLKPAEVKFKADALKLFTGISIEDATLADGVYRIGASTPDLMTKLATNYTTAFELVSVTNVAP